MFKRCAIFILVLIGLSTAAFSADDDWLTLAGGDWSDGANWSLGTAPTDADTARFPLLGAGEAISIDIKDTPRDATGLVFNPNSVDGMNPYTILDSTGGAGVIRIGSGGIIANGQSNQNSYTTTISAGIQISTDSTPISTDTTNSLVISGLVDGSVAGLGPRIQGNVSFRGTNGYTGDTELASGATLNVTKDRNLGALSAGVVFLGNSSIQVTGINVLDCPDTRGFSIGAGVVGTFDVALGSTGTIEGVISGEGTLAFTGGGRISVIGTNNTYQGGTQIGSFDLFVNEDANLGDVNGGISFTDFGSLHLADNFDIPATRTITVDTDSGPAIVCDEDGGTVTIRGPINSSGGVGNKIRLDSGVNPVDGGTIQFTNNFSSDLEVEVRGCVLVLSSANSLQGTAGFTLSTLSGVDPQLNTTVDITTSRLFTLNANTNEINPDANTTLTLNGQVGEDGGARSLTKVGAGTLVLGSTTNNYSGGTNISAGVVSVSDNGNLGADAGAVTFTANSTLNTTSGFTMAAERAISIGTGVTGTIETDDTTNATIIDGVISGAGTLNKTGSGQLTLSNTNTYSGGTTLNGGVLSVTGALDSSSVVTVGPSGTLKGTGSVGTVTSTAGGRVAPGASIGTLNIVGNYNQGPTSTLEIEINADGDSDLLAVTGTASVDGTLNVLSDVGLYRAGTTYRFLTAATRAGEFTSLVSSHPISFQILYGTTFIDLQVLTSTAVLPIQISDLRGNAKRSADYYFGNGFGPSDNDFFNTMTQLVNLPISSFETGLIKVTPLIYGALPLVNLQNDIRISHLLRKQYRSIQNDRIYHLRERNFRKNQKRREKIQDKSYVTLKNNSLWAEPIFFFYDQQSSNGRLTDEGQPGFDAYTYGSGLGWNHFFGEYFVLNIGGGYTHSSIAWARGFGSGLFNTVYFAPSVGWITDSLSAYILVQGSVYFYKMERKIHYAEINRKASNHHNSYDILGQVGVNYRLKVPRVNFFVQPDIEMNSLTIIEDGYKEDGADSLNLDVKNRTTTLLQPNFNFNFIYEIYTRHILIAPTVYIGWLANIPLGDKMITSRLVQEQTNRSSFQVLTYPDGVNQITLGFDVPIQNYQGLAFNVGYQANFLSQFMIQQVTARVEWDF